MKKNKKKSGEKIVFLIVIIIFVFSSVLAYASVSMKSTAPALITPEAQKETQTNKDLEKLGLNPKQTLEGVVEKLEPGLYSKGTHLLTADGVTIAILEAGAGINLDSYLDKNVKVWGDIGMVAEGDGAIVTVKKVEIAN